MMIIKEINKSISRLKIVASKITYNSHILLLMLLTPYVFRELFLTTRELFRTERFSSAQEVRFVHIIAPYQSDPRSPGDQFYSQPMAFKSILYAKKVAENLDKNLEIKLFSMTEKSDIHYAPALFENILLTRNFKTEYGNIFQNTNFTIKPIPFIKDIFDAAARNSNNGDFIIYTNADICLYKNFYIAVKQLIKDYDAIVIPRENDMPIFDENGRRFNLKELFSFRGKGKKHNGGDTFIIKKEIYDQIDLDDLLVGTVHWDSVMQYQLKSKSLNFLRGGGILTFHLGNDASQWRTESIESLYLQCWNLFVSKFRCNCTDDRWTEKVKKFHCKDIGSIYCDYFRPNNSNLLCKK